MKMAVGYNINTSLKIGGADKVTKFQYMVWNSTVIIALAIEVMVKTIKILLLRCLVGRDQKSSWSRSFHTYKKWIERRYPGYNNWLVW